MKKIFSIPVRQWLLVLPATMMFLIQSCIKDTDGSPQVGPGNPVLTAIDPAEAPGGTVLTITGSGLGDMRSIVFDKNNVPAQFMSTLNTESAIIFRVPDTAFGGPQNIVLTNSAGKTLVVPFGVVALPSVTSAFPTDFLPGTQVTLNGNNLDDVTKVILEGTSDQATIVSQSRKQMVIAMPATSAARGKLRLTNASGDRVTDIEFVNVAQAQTVFSDQLDNGFQSWSWGGDYTASGDFRITGASSMKAAYDPAGSWGGMQLGGGFINLAGYKYFSFWVKGADVDKNVQFWLNWGNQKVITVPANKWTYFRYELAVDYPGVADVNNVTFQIFESGKTIYFDNIMFTK